MCGAGWPSSGINAPQLFVVNPDGSGTEWLLQDRTEKMLTTWKEQGRLLEAPAPKEPRSTAFTVSGLEQSPVHRPHLADGRPQRVLHHPALDEKEREAFTFGVEDFTAWSAKEKAEADALIVKETRPQEEIDAETAVQARAAVEELRVEVQPKVPAAAHC